MWIPINEYIDSYNNSELPREDKNRILKEKRKVLRRIYWGDEIE